MRVQNLPASGATRTVVQGSTTIVEKPELEVGTKSPIAVVDAVIEKLVGVDPSPPTAPAMLLNPVHTTYVVATDAINIQTRIEVVHNVEQNVGMKIWFLNRQGHYKIQAQALKYRVFRIL